MMLERKLITTKGTKNSSQYIGKPLHEVLLFLSIHKLKNLNSYTYSENLKVSVLNPHYRQVRDVKRNPVILVRGKQN